MFVSVLRIILCDTREAAVLPMFSLSLWLLQIIQGLDFSLFENASVEMLWRCLSVQCVAFCSTEGREWRGGWHVVLAELTTGYSVIWQLDDILTCMLISHTIITVAAVQSALSLWTCVATSGFTWTASLPMSLTASLWEPVRWGHPFKYSAPLCLWRPRCRCPSPTASICAGEAHHGTESRRHPGSSSVRWSSTSSGQTR